MNFSSETYKQADEVLTKKRAEAEEKHARYLEELYLLHPALKKIDKDISSIGKKALKALEQNMSNGKIAKDALSKIELLDSERKSYIKEAKIKEKTNFFECKKCNDTGITNNKYCECREKIALSIAFDLSGLANDDLPSFDDFNVNLYDDTRVLRGKSYKEYAELSLKTAASFEKGPLLIKGETGLGKTFTAECIANKFIKDGKTVFYMASSRMFLMLEEHKFGQDNSQETKDRINLMHNADLLVIDDLGTEFRTSSGLVDTYLFELLEYRIKAKKSIVITTNLEPNDIKATYSDRIYSRLVGEFKWIFFFGDDLRLK